MLDDRHRRTRPLIRWLAGAALSLAASLACAGTATLSWTPPTEYTDGAPLEVAGYRLFERCGADAYGTPIAVPAPASTYTRTGLPDGTTCWWQLTALDALGVESERSVEVFKTFPAAGEPPGAPGALVVTWLGQAEPPAEPPDMALTFFWRCESETLDGTHDYSAGDTTATSVNSASIGAGGARVGSNGIVAESSGSRYQLDAASIFSVSEGSIGFFVKWAGWIAGQQIFRVNGTAANDLIAIETSGADGAGTRELLLRHRVSGGANILTSPTTAADIALNTWYFVIAKWNVTTNLLRLEVYDTDGTLLDATQDTAGIDPQADLITLQLGDTNLGNVDVYIDNVFVATAYDDAADILANFDITSHTEIGGGGGPVEDDASADASLASEVSALLAVTDTVAAASGHSSSVAAMLAVRAALEAGGDAGATVLARAVLRATEAGAISVDVVTGAIVTILAEHAAAAGLDVSVDSLAHALGTVASESAVGGTFSATGLASYQVLTDAVAAAVFAESVTARSTVSAGAGAAAVIDERVDVSAAHSAPATLAGQFSAAGLAAYEVLTELAASATATASVIARGVVSGASALSVSAAATLRAHDDEQAIAELGTQLTALLRVGAQMTAAAGFGSVFTASVPGSDTLPPAARELRLTPRRRVVLLAPYIRSIRTH